MVSTLSKPNFQSILEASTRVNWRVEDIINETKQLDFTKPFLPDSLADVERIQCLNPHEKLTLNQIRANSYLYLFGVVEEFIVPMVVDHVKQIGNDDIYATQAFLHFAEEESKHIRLFRRFAEEFERGFGTFCGGIGPAKAIGDAILAHHPLAVALVILQIEWMTQRHYLDSIRTNQSLDPQFCSLLRHHWLEEAQHARLDTQMVETIAAGLDPMGLEQGIEDYFKIGAFLDGGFKMQVQLDLESLIRATGRHFSEVEQQEILTVQAQSYRWTFIGSGMSHPDFVRTFEQVCPSSYDRLTETAQAFCY